MHIRIDRRALVMFATALVGWDAMGISKTETRDDNAMPKDSNNPTRAYSDLSGKVAVVTGGSRGIGADLCRRLGAVGAKVVVNGRDAKAVHQVVEDIERAGGRAVSVIADCTDPEAVGHLRAMTEKAFGPVNLLALFAGGGGEPAPILDMSLERWNAVMSQNLTTTFLPLQEFLRGMMERREGSIVTMSSFAARGPSRASAPYTAAKGAVMTLTRHIAAEVAPSNVRINCIAPASILTDRLSQQPEAIRRALAESYPLKRLGQTEDVSSAALFLLSSAAAWISGITLDIAGGAAVG